MFDAFWHSSFATVEPDSTLDIIKNTSSGFIEIICSGMDMPDLVSSEAHLKTMQKQVRAIFNELLKGKKNPEL